MDEMAAGFEGIALALTGLAGAVALGLFVALAGFGWVQGRRGAWRAAAGTGAALGLVALASAGLALAGAWRSPLDLWPAVFAGVAGPALGGHALGVLAATMRR